MAYEGYTLVGEEKDDGISAYGKKERPAWERVLSMVERDEVDVIVAYHVDRLTRNLTDLERLVKLTQEKGVDIATRNGDIDLTTDSGRMILGILAVVAKAEVERKAARQKRANLQRRQAGQMWTSGWRSFGYTLDGDVIPEEAVLIQQGADDLLSGVPVREIARRWQASGMNTPRNAADGWTHQGVKSVLRNPKVAGYMTYKGEITGEGAWDPILDRETFALVQAKLSDPARTTNGQTKGRKQPVNLLSSIAVCNKCGEGVTGRTMSVQKGPRNARVTVAREAVYSCPGYHLNVLRSEADALVLEAFAVAVRTHRPGLVLSIPSPGASLELHSEAETLRERLNELSDAFASGTINRAQMETASASLNGKLSAIEAAINNDPSNDYDPRKLKSEALERFLDLDLNAQRALLARLTRITLFPRGRGKRNVKTSDVIDMDVKATTPDGEVIWTPVLRRDAEAFEFKPGRFTPMHELIVNEAVARTFEPESLADPGESD